MCAHDAWLIYNFNVTLRASDDKFALCCWELGAGSGRTGTNAGEERSGRIARALSEITCLPRLVDCAPLAKFSIIKKLS